MSPMLESAWEHCGSEALGAFGYDEVLERLKEQLDLLIAACT